PGPRSAEATDRWRPFGPGARAIATSARHRRPVPRPPPATSARAAAHTRSSSLCSRHFGAAVLRHPLWLGRAFPIGDRLDLAARDAAPDGQRAGRRCNQGVKRDWHVASRLHRLNESLELALLALVWGGARRPALAGAPELRALEVVHTGNF